MRNRLYLVFLILVCMLLNSVLAQGPKRTMPLVEHDFDMGNGPNTDYTGYQTSPNTITDSPGLIVGYSYYDCQSNGASGQRTAYNSDGSLHFAWTNMISWPSHPGARYIYCNWMDSYGDWSEPEMGYQVSVYPNSAFASLDIRNDDLGVIAYNSGNQIMVSVEALYPGWAIFDHYIVPNQLYPQTPQNPGTCLWPSICVDRSNRIHVSMTENTGRHYHRLAYTRSDDGGQTWTNIITVDTVMVIGFVMTSSPVSDRVAIAYAETKDTSTQWKNDIVFYISENGTTWDWRYSKENITDYENDDDSLWAYIDLDAVFDYNDYLHIIWNAQWVTSEGVYFRTYLLHYSEETEMITAIRYWPDSLWYDIAGAWNRPICKMSLAAVEDYGIYALWTQFDTTDVSAAGYGNGDLYITFSYLYDYWEYPQNITNSRTPGCLPGNCDSDNWASLGEKTNGWEADIFYVNDKDAGSFAYNEGSLTFNPMKFYPYFPLDIRTEITGKPQNVSLNQNFPNPFNQSTSISFSLSQAGLAKLEIFDITGALVQTLVDESLPAGKHQVTWETGELASGTYFYKLTSSDAWSTSKAVLIK